MKRKHLFIVVGLITLAVLVVLLFWLQGKETKLNPKHIGINFVIHSDTVITKNKDKLRNDFLRPLLESNVITEKSGLERLFLTRVSIDETIKFSIPAIGINAFRYNADANSLKESSMTYTSREGDEDNFFNSWDADGYLALEKAMLSVNSKNKENVLLSELMNRSISNIIIQDSIIIDKSCITEKPPYIFKSTSNARKYINKILVSNPDALKMGTNDNEIHIFTYDGKLTQEIINTPEKNGEMEKDEEVGKDEEKIKVREEEKDTIKNIRLNSDKLIIWEGNISEIQVKINLGDTSLYKVIKQNSKFDFSESDKKTLVKCKCKISLSYSKINQNKFYPIQNESRSRDGSIHCYNLF